MNRILLLATAVALFSNAQAQDDFENEPILPAEAQECVLPASPNAIPEDATYDQLVAAKKQVAEFQGEVEVFRACLKEAEDNEDNTPGNLAAIVSSYNYSVEMEERVAERFNEAVRSYKERKAESED